MAIFEIQGPDGKTYEVDAPDVETATKAFAPAASGEPKSAAFSEGKAAAKQRIAAPDEYVEVPVYDFNGAATGATERVLKPKADPFGAGVLDVFPYGADIATVGRGNAPWSDTYGAEKQKYEGESEAAKEAYPGGYRAGQAGSIAGQAMLLRKLPLPGAQWGQGALAEGASLGKRGVEMLKRAGAGGVGGGIIGGVTGFGEGDTLGERLANAAKSTVVGGALGSLSVPVMEGVAGAAGVLYDKLGRPIVNSIRGALSPQEGAESLVSKSLQSRRQMTGEGPSEFDYMASKGEPIMVGDVGGEPTRDLARWAANISSEGKDILKEATTQRAVGQASRVQGDVERFFPNAPDYAETLSNLRANARVANQPVYDRAYAQGSTGMFNETLYDLSQAPTMKEAMRYAERRAKDQPGYGSTREGTIIDPFSWDRNGNLRAKEGMRATDANLAFWDIVKRNLDSRIEGLEAKGQYSYARDIMGQRRELINALEEMVPSYGNARSTAKRFYDAADAYEAGINLGKAKSAKDVSELFAAARNFTEPEREMFARGRAADILARIQSAPDKRNLLNEQFMGGSPLERAKNLMALGRENANALEARVRAEEIMGKLGPAVSGNSTTAQQLIQAGIIGGAGSGAVGGADPGSLSTGALAGVLLRAGKGKVDTQMATEVAKLLSSRDPAVLQRLTQMTIKNPGITDALRGVHNAMFSGQRALISGKVGAELTEPKQGP